jgi:type II secretory pathway component HofQ
MADVVLIADLTATELYHAALFARVCLVIREAEAYDFLSADFDDIDLERCEEILAVASHQDIVLSDDAVDAALIGAIGRSDG